MVFVLGSRAYGHRVGVLASAFVALAVIHIQLSHFLVLEARNRCFCHRFVMRVEAGQEVAARDTRDVHALRAARTPGPRAQPVKARACASGGSGVGCG